MIICCVGIDLSETLQYPDFSCVVLYKQLGRQQGFLKLKFVSFYFNSNVGMESEDDSFPNQSGSFIFSYVPGPGVTVVVGFAFLVPDTGWNESYLSYCITHPDWQQAGIGILSSQCCQSEFKLLGSGSKILFTRIRILSRPKNLLTKILFGTGPVPIFSLILETLGKTFKWNKQVPVSCNQLMTIICQS